MAENKDIQSEINGICTQAIIYARSFGKVLDYSDGSIKDLEGILDYYSADILKNRPTDRQIWSMALIFGAYLGETVRKNILSVKGCRWTEVESDMPILKNAAGASCAPIHKVCKRLVNGGEESVISFYDYAKIFLNT